MKMKKYLFFLLFVLFLSGCGATIENAHTDLSVEEIAKLIVESQTDRPESGDIRWLDETDDALDRNLSVNGVERDQWIEGYWAKQTMGWKYPFSVLILRFENGTSEKQIEETMLGIVSKDVENFYDILPESSLYIRDNHKILINPPYAAMVICPDTEGAAETFFSCFTAGKGSSAVWKDENKTLDVTYPYHVPEDSPAGVYDCGPILTAWKTEDPSGLKEQDRAVYEACLSVKEKLFSPGQSGYEMELAIHDWLLENVTVSVGGRPEDDEKETPYGALVQKEANCLGFATTFQLLMELAGQQCITVSGASSRSERFHAWNMVNLDGVWYCVDASWNKGRVWPYTFFNVTSEFMAQTDHQWDESAVPVADRNGPRP